MILLIVVLVLVVGGIVAVVTGRVGSDSMSDATQTSAFELPDGTLGAHGVDSVRFDQALRGYNMGQVDAVLDRLFDEIASLERQVAGVPRDAARPVEHRVTMTKDGEVPVVHRAGEGDSESDDADGAHVVADHAPRRARHAADDDRP